jgi:hypothetical protein
MSLQNEVMDAYHRATARHREKTGESFPLIRESCVEPDGTITTTSAFEPELLAKWRQDASGRIRIKLIRATR